MPIAPIFDCKSAYPIVLMDIGLPDIDGTQVTAKIRQQEQKSKRPKARIIALTAYSVAEIKDRCLKAGIDQIVNKPVGFEQLRDLLAAVSMRGANFCHI